MSGWRQFIYVVPDDGHRLLFDVVEALPAYLGGDLTATPYGGFRLQVSDPSAALFLRLSVNGLGVADDEHPFLEPGDLFVPEFLRPRCEHELATRCRSSAVWEGLMLADFRTPAARAFFEQTVKQVEERRGRQ